MARGSKRKKKQAVKYRKGEAWAKMATQPQRRLLAGLERAALAGEASVGQVVVVVVVSGTAELLLLLLLFAF